MSIWARYSLLPHLADYFGFYVVEERGRVQRFDSTLSIYVYCEDNAKHNRPHGHITLNDRKIGEIYLDTWEIVDNNALRKTQLKEINKWLADNKETMKNEWEKCNHRIDINFLCRY